jgi:hypothetical protein
LIVNCPTIGSKPFVNEIWENAGIDAKTRAKILTRNAHGCQPDAENESAAIFRAKLAI